MSTESKRPLSVLMPVYNAERYVAEAVESVLAQTFGDFEFLIIDDGSTDGSRAILERYAARDARIRLTSRPNTGYLVALNEMIDAAGGEYLARMDADDISYPDRFRKQMEYMREHPGVVLVGSTAEIIDPDGDTLHVMGGGWLSHEEIDAALLGGLGQVVYHPSVIMRADAVRRLGGYRAEYYLTEDLDLFLRLAEVGRIVNLAEPLIKYREHLAKVGHARTAQQADAMQRTLVDAHRRRGLAPYAPGPGAVALRPRTHAQIHRTWAWWALGARHVATARKHALRSVADSPLDVDSWRALYCALRGR
ncbi:Putative glycosyltransferase EpsE [Aquisphaera giovannonii]|uniref:Glycosyltransferase EpsE n=1 Tax=Aquisphaera giovannonii TaxID=406548 RepID=A0A5B9W347_9BACT|nr:glycosyltransferase [Aquisphaera giovannonii]QEH35018.1 Putative glycosyltransferase EpsE [Aquisphaera giovannonii]